MVEIRYLPGAPEKPLGPRRIGDVGINYGIYKKFIALAVYVVLMLLFAMAR